MENDESSESNDSDCGKSGDLDEVPQPKMNPGQQNTTTQDNVGRTGRTGRMAASGGNIC